MCYAAGAIAEPRNLHDQVEGGSGLLPTLARDWQVTGIATLQSGSPFTVNLGTDVANIAGFVDLDLHFGSHVTLRGGVRQEY